MSQLSTRLSTRFTTRLAARTAGIVSGTALALSLTACTPAAVALTSSTTPITSPATSTSSSESTSTPTATRRLQPGTGGPGSLTLSLTSPKQLSGHVDAEITCVTGHVYRAYATGVVQGYTVRITATAAGYTGPGSYPTTLTGSIVAPGGEAFALAGVRTTASLSDTGGSTSVQVTGDRGHTLAGSLSWSCS